MSGDYISYKGRKLITGVWAYLAVWAILLIPFIAGIVVGMALK